jgi:hypothetical protein
MHYGPDGDAIAQEAARLLLGGRAEDVPGAIRQAMEQMRVTGLRPPSLSMVKRHVEALSMQALGDAGYAELGIDAMRIAEDVMTILDERFEPVLLLLAGRLAEGRHAPLDAIHLRIYARDKIGDIAAALVEHGFEEPAFETATTRFGRLDRLRFKEGDSEVVVTRCLPELAADVETDLHTGRAVATIGLEGLRRRLSAPGGAAE